MSKSFYIGIAVTALIHGSLAGGVAAFSSWGDDDDDDRPLDMLTIEASLAYKAEQPPPEQPQKEQPRKPKKVKPQGVSRDENKKVEEKQPEEQLPTLEDLRDKYSTEDDADEDWEQLDTDIEPDKAGQFDGSKHGFAEVSRGDPYLQELAAEVNASWEVPTLETGKGSAIGCVRLHVDGSVIDTKLHQTSTNANIDLSVKQALDALKKKRKPGTHPVPRHLEVITKQWTCINFSV